MEKMVSPKRIIRSRAPVRFCDLGGGTDSPQLMPEGLEGAVLNMSLASYVWCSAQVNAGQRGMRVNNLSEGWTDVLRPGMADQKEEIEQASRFIQMAKTRYQPALAPSVPGYAGASDLEVNFRSEAPSKRRLGTSAALAVAAVAVLDYFTRSLQGYKGSRNPETLALEAYEIEQTMLGVVGGNQNHLAAANGKVTFIDYRNGVASPQTFELSPTLRYELEERLVLVNTGSACLSGAILGQSLRHSKEDQSRLLSELTECARAGFSALRDYEDLNLFGEAMNENWKLQQEFWPASCSENIAKLSDAVTRLGVLGFKANGAGGGGTVTILTEPNKSENVRQAAQKLGMEVLPVRLASEGLRVWQTLY
jgi:galactokinase/mevalonate kinase-like predicted kinase